MVKEEDKKNNLKQMVKPYNNLMNMTICLVLASKIEDYSPLCFKLIWKLMNVHVDGK
jgi:hypothetical protein